MLRVVIFVFVVFGKMQDKQHICGGQEEADRDENKQYYSEAVFHLEFSSSTNRTNINLQL
jgi:hypothetical protein